MNTVRKVSLFVGSGFLSIGIVAGPIAFQSPIFGGEASGAGATAVPTGTTMSSDDVAPLDSAIPEGDAEVNIAAPRADVPPVGRVHTTDGAAGAFANLATWGVLSDQSRQDPEGAVKELGDDLLNPADATMLASMSRSSDDAFDVAEGAYRVLGWSGEESAPDQVMVEITAPLRLAGSERWAVVGGVVAWADGEWHLTSIAPREVAGSDPNEAPVGITSDVAAGQGWVTFANTSAN